MVKRNWPANAEGIRDMCWEGVLEKDMATHSGLLSWRSPWTEEPGGLRSMEVAAGSQSSDTTEAT